MTHRRPLGGYAKQGRETSEDGANLRRVWERGWDLRARSEFDGA